MVNSRSTTFVRLALVLAVLTMIGAACGGAGSDPPATTGSGPATTQVPPTQPDTGAPTTVPPTVPSSEGPAIGDASIIAVIQLTGGCQMMGPNCPTFVLWTDGRASAVRGAPPVDPFAARLPDEAVESVGFIDPSLAAALTDAVATTDFAALVPQLGPGVCNGCVDGIDTIVSIATLSGIVTLSSTDVGFDVAEPFFAALNDAVVALQQEMPLALQSR